MSTSSSASLSRWQRYGAVQLTRCPDCPRPDSLKRWASKTDQNDNLGCEFVRCSSKTLEGRDGKILKKCDHFEWMDAYIERLQFEGYIDSNGAATWVLNLGLPPNAVDNWGDRAVMTTRNARNADLPTESELNKELKKIKKHLKQMVDLQKQANGMQEDFMVVSLLCFFTCCSSVARRAWIESLVRLRAEDVIYAPCQVRGLICYGNFFSQLVAVSLKSNTCIHY
ncbi:hypothetical protein D1007_21302 [Hordeum vulgare]|nr:hypothetical protein D1007_21302 [Hordeum vulgare]